MEECRNEPGPSSSRAETSLGNVIQIFEEIDEDIFITEEIEVPTSPATSRQGWFDKIKKAGSAITESIKPSSSKEGIKTRLWSSWNNFKYSGKWMSDRTREYEADSEIVLLGSMYFIEEDDENIGFDEFVLHYYSRIWITYRTHMKAICGTTYTTDCGWGCMIRTTQMMVAQSILVGMLGRDWRSPKLKQRMGLLSKTSEEDDQSDEILLQITKLFEDCPSSPLGFHRLMCLAFENIGQQAIGRWYTPSESVSLMRKAISTSTSPLISDIGILLCVDGLLSLSDVEIVSKTWTKKILIIITVRLGTSEPNKIYMKHIQQLLKTPSCVGIVGGKPKHSLYFLGYYKEQLIYLDPHVARDYIPLPDTLTNEKQNSPIFQFHCKYLSMTPYVDIDPSCAIGFFIQSHQEFTDMVETLEASGVIDLDVKKTESSVKQDPLFAVLLSDNPKYRFYEPASSSDNLGEDEDYVNL
ncbi:unnamed protein product [Auanema sp. JU1783]|nr:unnamed protein product [Auanema sp. JU1783]